MANYTSINAKNNFNSAKCSTPYHLCALTKYKYNMYMHISKMADQSQPVNPRMHYVVLTVTSSELGSVVLFYSR